MLLGVKNKALRYLLQVFNYSIFMALIWYFSSEPPIRIIEADEAVVTIALAHAGKLREPCRNLSQEELMKLPPNMRKLDECPRERSPVTIKALLDGKVIFNKTQQPPGIFKDGSINIYYSTKIPAGKHRFEIKMDDSVREPGFNYSIAQDVDIQAAHILLVGFDSLKGFSID